MRNGLENTNTLDKTNQLMVKKRFYVNNSEKKKEKERENLVIMEGVKIWFKNYYALTSFMWFP